SVSTHLSLIHPPLPHPHPHSFPTRRSSDLPPHRPHHHRPPRRRFSGRPQLRPTRLGDRPDRRRHLCRQLHPPQQDRHRLDLYPVDRKSTRLNSSHGSISYAVFCLKKKTKKQ